MRKASYINKTFLVVGGIQCDDGKKKIFIMIATEASQLLVRRVLTFRYFSEVREY